MTITTHAVNNSRIEVGMLWSGTYQMQQRLGQGAMGEVWLAKHLLLDELRAIKLVLGELNSDSIYRQLFVQSEARFALRLDRHPNIVRVYELGHYQDTPFIVMEYVPTNSQAPDLKTFITQKGRFTPQEVGIILYQIAAVLEVTHRQNLVHRDVKPANVLIDLEGRMKLNDFGLIKDYSQVTLDGKGKLVSSPNSSSMDTYSGGTPSYCVPEQANRQAEPRSDQYSLCVIVYQMLTGQLPFRGKAVELKELHAHQPPPPLQDFVPGLDTKITQVVLKARAKRPADRWATVREFATAYRQALAGEKVTGQETVNWNNSSAPGTDRTEPDLPPGQ